MGLLNQLGISYKANYLVQGNQIERLNTSKKLNVLNTELMIRTDGKDSDIESILKNYDGNIVFHLPAINPDLSNLNVVNDVVRKLKAAKVKLITIDASNLLLDLFEFSTLEEQKKYFLNIVTAISTLVSNKIELAIQNLKSNSDEDKFGCNIDQLTDIVIYVKKLLIKDFGFTEEDCDKYIGISLNIDNINIKSNNDIINYLDVFKNQIKCIKITDLSNLELVLNYLEENNYEIPIFMQTKSDLEEVENEYKNFKKKVKDYLKENDIQAPEPIKTNNKGFSNIIIYTMIVLTIIIIVLMFIIKLR